jgi:hypothetical protein
VLVEAYHLIRKLKWYYIIIQKAYNCITIKILSFLNRKIALQMLFKAINDFISPDKLILTLLVYSVYLRITKYNPPSFTIL